MCSQNENKRDMVPSNHDDPEEIIQDQAVLRPRTSEEIADAELSPVSKFLKKFLKGFVKQKW